jgi:hypothetical protein
LKLGSIACDQFTLPWYSPGCLSLSLCLAICWLYLLVIGIFVCGVLLVVDLARPVDLGGLDEDKLMEARLDMGMRVGGSISDMVIVTT